MQPAGVPDADPADVAHQEGAGGRRRRRRRQEERALLRHVLAGDTRLITPPHCNYVQWLDT